MGDGDGFGSQILDTVGEVGGAVGSELKKFGKSAASQVTGGQDSSSNSTNNSAKNKSSSPGDNPVGEFKKVGQSIVGQISGREPRHDEIAEMKKNDDEFSEAEHSAVAVRIQQIYEEHAAKRASEAKKEEMVEGRKEEVKAENLEVQKKQEFTNSAIQKTRAEIKNYGAE
ncbi:MAG: hypothetical protein NUV69_01290 [Candidatus Curtissbacteria bacterium]|nr:hypothetical protein [Candidatus Curtissbacteria bacterium]